MPLVTLAQVKTYMGLTGASHDEELTRLLNAATGAVQSHAGPTLLAGSQTDYVVANGGNVGLKWPLTAITSVTPIGSETALDASASVVINPNSGAVRIGYVGDVTVVYTAGLAEVPPEAEDAALVWISYKYRRNHGGSESYMPAGVDGAVNQPMGVAALERQVKLALGQYARGGRVG